MGLLANIVSGILDHIEEGHPMNKRERFLFNAYGDDHKATIAATAKFFELCKEYGNGIIYVPTMKGVETTLLASAIGEESVKKLAKNTSMITSSGQKVSLCSDRTFNKHKNADVYLVLWATPSMIDNVESNAHSSKAIVVVTWLKEDADSWVAGHKPTKLAW